MSETHHSPAIKWWVTAPGGITHTAPFVINGTHSSCITLCNRCDHFKLCIGVIAIELREKKRASGSCAVWHVDHCQSYPFIKIQSEDWCMWVKQKVKSEWGELSDTEGISAAFCLERGCLCIFLCLTGRFHRKCGFPSNMIEESERESVRKELKIFCIKKYTKSWLLLYKKFCIKVTKIHV